MKIIKDNKEFPRIYFYLDALSNDTTLQNA
jgi:hypothetical protein